MKHTLLFLLALVFAPLFGARDFVRASNQMLTHSAATVTAYPVSMSAWFRTSDLTVNQVIVANVEDSTGVGVYLLVRGVDAGDPLSASDFDGSTAARANSGGSVTSGTWHHGGATYSAINARSVFLDGARTDNSTSVTAFSATNRTRIGALISGNSHWSGQIAEVAIWDVVLTDAEMLVLAAGFSPLVVRPSSLRLYLPLWGNIFEYVGGRTFTDSNGSTNANIHPRIYRR